MIAITPSFLFSRQLAAFAAVALSFAWFYTASGQVAPERLASVEEAKARLAAGDDLFSQGQYGAAISEYSRAIELKPDFAAAYNNRGYAAYSKYDGTDALPDLNRALQLRPDFPHAYNTRGCILMANGRTDEAIADFNRAIELEPDYPRAYRNRACALMKKGHIGTAFTDFERAGGHPRRIAAILVGSLAILGALGIVILRRTQRHR